MMLLDVINEMNDMFNERISSKISELLHDNRKDIEIRLQELEGLKIELSMIQDIVQIYITQIESGVKLIQKSVNTFQNMINQGTSLPQNFEEDDED